MSIGPTQIGHRHALDTNTTDIRHIILRIPFKKYYFLDQICVGYGSNTVKIQPIVFFLII